MCEEIPGEDFEVGGSFEGGIGFLDADIAKAFDKVDISFGIKVFEKLGLGPGFIKWISLFYRGAKASIVVNGLVGLFYLLGCGIRQGCPISPLLFNLVMEALTAAIRKDPKIESVMLDGGQGWEPGRLTQKQFADDHTTYMRQPHVIHHSAQGVTRTIRRGLKPQGKHGQVSRAVVGPNSIR